MTKKYVTSFANLDRKPRKKY